MNQAYSGREGADIFASDMVQSEVQSKVAATFDDSTVFLTGATGYLGKMFMEKLLRSSPKLKKIYILVRPKKGKDVKQRFEEIFDGPNMVPMKLKNPNYMSQVAMISGDCSLPDLGMDKEEKEKVIKETDIIIHCAATVRFDEKIRTAAHINVRAVRDLLAIAKQMKHLKAFLHVSTAFSHCVRKEIGETFYESGMAPDKLLDLVDAIDEDRLTKITPGLLGEWPNSYVFTKAIAEDLVKQELKNLPIGMLRPGIVISSVNEPVKGWIDNFYGATGGMVGAALGVLRSVQGRDTNRTEVVPADYVVNAGISIIWDLASRRDENRIISTQEETEEPVFNFVNSTKAPLTWRDFYSLSKKHAVNVPSELQVWHNFFSMREGRLHHLIACFLLHTLPAYIVDFICICLRREPMMIKAYQKINKFMDVVSYFAMREWIFKDDNLQNLWDRMEPEDKKVFPFVLRNFDWDTFFHFYVKGGRVYLLKDPLETIPKGRIKYWKLFAMHYTLLGVLLLLFFKLLCTLCSCIF